MWQNSSELLNYAFRELQLAVEDGKQEVEIVLHKTFENDSNKIKKFSDNLKIKTITEKLSKEFGNYDIRSEVFTKRNFSFVLSHMDAPCDFFYPLVWKLTLQKKEA